MAMLGELKGIPHYPCPMCGTPVYSSALQCPSCGTDLTRAGVVFSSSGTSVEWKRQRGPGIWVALVAVTALGVAAGTVGRPWVEEFAAPGLTVAKAGAERAFRSVQQQVSRLPGKVRRAGKPGTADRVRSAAKVSPTNAPTTPPKLAARVAAPPVAVRQKVHINHQGYRPVTRTVVVEPGKRVTVGVSPATPAAKPAPVHLQAATLLDVGRLAPQFVAKDRVGLLYRTTDYRGRKLLMVFVQNLDGNAQRIIRELNALHSGGARGVAIVVVLRPDRVSIRQFTQSEQIQIPVLFGTQTMARAYGMSSQPAVLYLVSEDGRVVLRQVGRVNPGSALH